MKLKNKLYLAFGLVFAFTLTVSILGWYHLTNLENASKQILKDNYRTLQYVQAMLQILDDAAENKPFRADLFEKNLQAQETNITEKGEKETTKELRTQFELLKRNLGNTQNTIQKIREALYQLADLNMQASYRKNEIANQTAQNGKFYLISIASACTIASLLFALIFPSIIARPIQLLSLSIQQIATKNYAQRLNFNSKDEFGEVAKSFNSMAEKLNEYENSNLAKILFEKKRIETIINNMPDAVIGLNENKIILFANQKATQLLGLQEKDLLGKYAPDVATINDLMRHLIQELMIGFAEWEKHEYAPLKIYAEEKENIFTKEILDVSLAGTGETQKKLIGHVIILKNITTFKELDAAKTNFIATISHELKTPLSSIKMSLKLLENQSIGNLNEEQKELLAHIQEDSTRLLKITSELLNIAQIETGNIQLNLHECNPKEIVEYAVEALQMQAEQKNIRIQSELTDTLPSIAADQEKTTWVLVNLLSNAIRYSPENNQVIIAVKQIKGIVRFMVQDFGKGIDLQYQEKVFERYFQVPQQSNGFYKEGTGLGLAISKEFILAQKGNIWVESIVDEGSKFCFELPIG